MPKRGNRRNSYSTHSYTWTWMNKTGGTCYQAWVPMSARMEYIMGHTYMTSGVGGAWGEGSPKSRQKERGCMNYVRHKGGGARGVKKIRKCCGRHISIVPQKTQIEKLHIFFIVCNVCNLLQFHKKKSVSLSIWMNASLLWWWLYHMSVWPAAAMLSEHASGSGKQMTSE